MVRIYNQDCMVAMKQMKDKYFDLAIVDPPYGIGLKMVYNVGANKNTLHKQKQWNDAVPGEEYFAELHRVSKHQIIWGCNYYAKFIPAVGRIVHDKGISDDSGFNFSQADLASCSLQNRITIFKYTWQGNFQGKKVNWKNSGIDSRIHPTQKPVKLYTWLLEKYAFPGDKILDTHLGSGSSAIAAYELGYDLTGYEIDVEYFAAAQERLNHHMQQGRLFE